MLQNQSHGRCKCTKKKSSPHKNPKHLQLLNFLPTFPFFQLRALSIWYKIINLDDLDIINEFSNRVKSWKIIHLKYALWKLGNEIESKVKCITNFYWLDSRGKRFLSDPLTYQIITFGLIVIDNSLVLGPYKTHVAISRIMLIVFRFYLNWL